ncbi:MAG: hypothetical protein ACTHKR_14910 [Sphingomonas sp.]
MDEWLLSGSADLLLNGKKWGANPPFRYAPLIGHSALHPMASIADILLAS